jgi:mRNA interferase MazF
MTNYQASELVLVTFPFTAGPKTKKRAALVLLDTGDNDVLVARVTSQAPSTPNDVRLANWQQSGLLLPSTVRLHKLATVDKSVIARRIGLLETSDRQQVSFVLQQMFGNW